MTFYREFGKIKLKKSGEKMTKIVVIGGGASGLVASIFAKDKNNEVIILEKNNTCGKKILITGNGKCNYFNEDFTINHYRSSNLKILEKIITNDNKNKVLSFFDNIGILPKIKKGYYYPNSNQAMTIKEALVLQTKLSGIIIQNNTVVQNIEYKKDKFIITTNNNTITCEKVILSTGSKVAPLTGSDGFSYKILNKLGHSIITPLPALTPINCIGNFFKDWNGIRTDATVTMLENNQVVASSTGEIQLTNQGISGICVFQLSGRIIRSIYNGKKVKVSINFLPQIEYNDINDILAFLNNRNHKVKNRTISELLDGILNYKLANLILKQAKINRDTIWNNLTNLQKENLCKYLCKFTLEVDNNYLFDKAQICSGGIPLTEININTMESIKQKNLYLTGELLDVDGDCGGYNLGFAWLSGMIAGENAKGGK